MPAPQRVDREQFRQLAVEGLSNAELAEHFGCSENTVTRLRKITGTVNARRMTPERLARIERMLDDGMPFKEIHRTEGADMQTLRRYFPGRQWTREQSIEHSATLRRLGAAHHWNNYPLKAAA